MARLNKRQPLALMENFQKKLLQSSKRKKPKTTRNLEAHPLLVMLKNNKVNPKMKNHRLLLLPLPNLRQAKCSVALAQIYGRVFWRPTSGLVGSNPLKLMLKPLRFLQTECQTLRDIQTCSDGLPLLRNFLKLQQRPGPKVSLRCQQVELKLHLQRLQVPR